MHVTSQRKLKEFWERHPDVEQPLRAWHADVKHADWESPSDIKEVYRNASIIANSRVVFNIKGNKYRLVAAIRYESRVVFVRFVGTHREYDRIDAVTI
jgi:mRNA interferase HigB